METLRLKTGLISVDKPQVIDDLRNGQSTFNYNHNIKEIEVEQNAGNTEGIRKAGFICSIVGTAIAGVALLIAIATIGLIGSMAMYY